MCQDFMLLLTVLVERFGIVDEATGYQYDRARDALSTILEEFIAKELAQWVKTFPDEFYKKMYDLHPKLDPKQIGAKKPQLRASNVG